MVALLDDAAAVEHQDAVEAAHGRQPMRDHDRGASLHQPLHRLLDQRLRLRVQARRRLVQDQHARIRQERPRQRHPLPLAARQLDAALADQRAVALRQARDELMRVGDPGRLLDLISQNIVTLRDIKFFVLDEADRMLDMGFVHDVQRVIIKLPENRQTLFFSATMPPEIQKLAAMILKNPAKVEVTPVSSTADTITQSIYYVKKQDKRHLLQHILKDDAIKTLLVFARTKHGADRVVKDLVRVGITAEAIHGNKSQNARQRALSNFKTRQTRVLVATDIAARGIDIDELTHVVNFELPNVPETYVHRIGRTGRAGANGIAISFCEEEEKPFLKDILKLINREIPVVKDQPFHDALVGMEAVKAPMPQNRPKKKAQGGGGGFHRNRQGHVNAPKKHKPKPQQAAR